MQTSVKWINDYLDRPADADEQAELLTRAGFPIESSEPVEGDDRCQDVETTSNRGDCLAHVGLAREIATLSGRTLKPPHATPPTGGGAASDHIRVVNECPDECPRYTARIIRGITVGPSPAWLASRLRAIGQIPRNALVDATNFVLFELGQPTHVFDLDTLRGGCIRIRRATTNEPFQPIGEGAAPVKLTPEDLVIADAERAVAMAGVKGGALTAVTKSTTNVLLEAATFSPVAVRTSSRRHQIASDSSYRFERGVHPAQVDAAAARLAALILDLCGGTLLDGVVSDGAPMPDARIVSLRPDRCRAILGVDVPTADIVTWLGALGFDVASTSEGLRCQVPPARLDIEREIDLIEEVGRMYGLDRIPLHDALTIRVQAPQSTETARQAVHDALAGMGFVETVTHSLISEPLATAFLREGESALRVDDDRAKSDPILRPSIVPSLLRVRKHNENNGVTDLKLFEAGATFFRRDDRHEERICLGLLEDVTDPALGVRSLRGVAERLVRLLRGPDAAVSIEPDDGRPWLAPGARVRLDGEDLGWIGVISRDVRGLVDLGHDTIAAELTIPALYARDAADPEARPLPAFPAIARDISAIVDESVAWRDVERTVADLALDHHEATQFVTTFRGKQIPAGRKSLTLRIVFRAPDRTLTHDEVTPQADAVMRTLTERLNAEIRS
ncbi:MAG: phenylalanine--tRNA ligase subunit beta [Phycisphaerales bacterium]|nr:phenylalanine--tRNA ligase subunit beta [Phycisphaerales bacterium]